MIGAFEHTLRPAIFCFIGFLLFVFTLFLLAPLPASAQSTCHLITTANASQVPAGYGIPFNVLTSAREMLIRASCASTSVTVDVGVGNNLHYIYKQGYQWRNNAWAQYTLTGSNAAADWIVGSGRATPSPAPQMSLQSPTGLSPTSASRAPTGSSPISASGPETSGSAAAATRPARPHTGSCKGSEVGVGKKIRLGSSKVQ